MGPKWNFCATIDRIIKYKNIENQVNVDLLNLYINVTI